MESMDLTALKQRIKTGKLYFESKELMAEQQACLETLYDFNQTRPSQGELRTELLKKLLASMGENCYIEPPLRANWGRNTHIGNNFYANFNLTLVDDGDIFIGDDVMIAPNVIIDTATHPISPELRKKRPSLTSRCGLETTCGSARGRSCSPASPWGTIR